MLTASFAVLCGCMYVRLWLCACGCGQQQHMRKMVLTPNDQQGMLTHDTTLLLLFATMITGMWRLMSQPPKSTLPVLHCEPSPNAELAQENCCCLQFHKPAVVIAKAAQPSSSNGPSFSTTMPCHTCCAATHLVSYVDRPWLQAHEPADVGVELHSLREEVKSLHRELSSLAQGTDHPEVKRFACKLCFGATHLDHPGLLCSDCWSRAELHPPNMPAMLGVNMMLQ